MSDKASPYTIMVPTAYGMMLVNRNDHNQTNALFKLGLCPEHNEIGLVVGIITRVFKEGEAVFIDVGANFGTYSLTLAHYCKKVIAFEPQRIIYNMLCGSVALNSLENVYCHNLAVGDKGRLISVPKYDYWEPLNFGSIEFGVGPLQEKLDQEIGQSTDEVGLIKLDNYINEAHFLKIDAEGMGFQVLQGAEGLIEFNKPFIFAEVLKEPEAEMREWLEARGYTIYTLGINILCVPDRFKDTVKFEVKGGAENDAAADGVEMDEGGGP